MRESDVTHDEESRGEVGDVEAAGETTAAAAIEGPVDERPVGAETRVRVEGDEEDGGE